MSENYVAVFLNSIFANASPLSALSLFFLFLARMLPILAQAPFFGAKLLPHTTKMALAVSLFVIFLPKLLVVMTTAPTFDTSLIWLVIKEMVIGTILGFLITVPFTLVQNAGIFIDHQRGGASLMVNDPAVQNQSSPLGTLFNLVLIYIFFVINGPFLFIDSILISYDVIPPDQFINPLLFSEGSQFWDVSISLLNNIMKISVQLASPGLITILMTDMFLGIANRLAPQVQITFLGLPLKSLLGLTAVTIGWSLFSDQMAHEAYVYIQKITELIYSFQNPLGL